MSNWRMLLIQRLWVECKVCLSHAEGFGGQNLFLVLVQSAIDFPTQQNR